MFITQRQELAIRLLYFFLPWPLSKLLPPNLGRLFFGPGGLPSSYFLDSLPFSIDTPGTDPNIPIYPDILPGEIPVSTDTPSEPVLPVSSSGLPQPPASQLPVITPEPISSIPRYESVPAKVIPTSFTLPSSKSPVRPSAFVSSRGRGGSEAVSIFMPLPGTPGKVSEIPFKQSLPKISPQKSLFSSSRGRGGSVSTSIFMPLPGRKLSPATVSIKQPLPYQAGDKSRQTTLIKSISYKNTTPRMQRLLSMSNRHVLINPTQGLSMQQSSFVSGHSYTNLVRAFKPQASFPFGHTGGARGGSYSISYFGNLMPFGVPLFDSYRTIQPNAAGGGAAYLWNPADKSDHITISGGGRTALIDSSASGTCANPGLNGVRSDKSYSTGLVYWEILVDTFNAGTGLYFGIVTGAYNICDAFCGSPEQCLYSCIYSGLAAGGCFNSGLINISFYRAYSGDTIQFAHNVPAGKIYFGKNNTWYSNKTPDDANGPLFSGLGSGPWFIFLGGADSNHQGILCSLSSHFSYTCPSGYTPIGEA